MSKQVERVAVIRGGQSAEREISLKSGQAVVDALADAPCDVFEYDTEPSLGESLRRDGIDVAFIALHGRGGEDGVIQGMLEWNNIPYTGPGVGASSTCMDKIRCKQIFQALGWETPDWFVLGVEDEIRPLKTFDRYVVKPRFEGSSLGMSIVDDEEFKEAVARAREYDGDLLVEEYIEGYEVTVGVVQREDVTVLPPVGIRPSHEYFDFETKYTKGLTEYDVPAQVNKEISKKLKDHAGQVARELKTISLCRVDYIVSDETPHLLEINTIPGLTETSLLPKAASEAGIGFSELIWSMVCSAGEVQQWHAA